MLFVDDDDNDDATLITLADDNDDATTANNISTKNTFVYKRIKNLVLYLCNILY